MVLQAVQLAIEGRDREREMMAVLLASLCPDVLSRDQVALGFTRLLACAEVLPIPATHASDTHMHCHLANVMVRHAYHCVPEFQPDARL